MAHDADVVVVGAGPGGCAVAMQLASRGHEVLVVDRGRPSAGGKVCGEGLMPHGRAALARLGVASHDLGAPFRGIAYTAGSAHAMADFSGGRTGVGVRRARLDPRLREAAQARSGVRFVEGAKVRGWSGSPGAMRLDTTAGEVTGRVVVGADGLHSTVRRLAGLGAPARGPRRYGARMHLRLAPGRKAPTHVHVHARGAWEAYITPVADDEINVALLLDERVSGRLKGDRDGGFRALVQAFPDLADVFDGAQPLSEVAVCGPLRQRVRSVVSDGVVLVGDAAGFVDAVTGEGMSLTLLSAEAAAEAVSVALHRGRFDRRALTPYARRRARLVWTLCTLTEVVVFGLRHPWWATRVVDALGRSPQAFERFLAVQTGEGSLWSLARPLAEVTWAVARGLPFAAPPLPGCPDGQLALG